MGHAIHHCGRSSLEDPWTSLRFQVATSSNPSVVEGRIIDTSDALVASEVLYYGFSTPEIRACDPYSQSLGLLGIPLTVP